MGVLTGKTGGLPVFNNYFSAVRKACSAFAAALLLFLALNMVLGVCASNQKMDTGPSSNPMRKIDSVALLLEQWQRLDRRPNIVMMGSSLLQAPFWSMDKVKDGTICDIFSYRGAKCLERKLEAMGWQSPCVFDFAGPLQMVSDDYIYLDQFLTGDRIPDVVIFGLAPRDFRDFDISSPAKTPPFRRLVNFDNLPKYADLVLPSWKDRLDFAAENSCMMYGKRHYIQRQIEAFLYKLYTLINLPDPKDESKIGFLKPIQILGSVGDQLWQNSLAEYRMRYRDISHKSIGLQMNVLRKAMALCKSRGIRVIVVNMPLSEDNRSLMTSEFYQVYRGKLAISCNAEDATFLDLGDSQEFTRADFWDSSHLGLTGAYKFLDNLCRVVPTSPLQ